MARSSSRSASHPWLMTPPSRTNAAGSSSKNRLSITAQPSGGCKSLKIPTKSAGSPIDTQARSSVFNSVCCSATSSRGRTWRSAMRAVMRSTSLLPLSCARSVCCRPLRKCEMASNLAAASSRSRRGVSSQLFKVRLPMPVVQVSSNENSVGDSSPRRVCVSSRLRRVVNGSSIKSPERTTCKACTCGNVRPCVCSA